jgi:omega-6 fatty acid desaturase (delta-12 desaturase)
VIRDIVFSLVLYKFAASITPLAQSDFGGFVTGGWQKTAVKSAMWMSYWWFQGLVMAGIFCLGEL